MQEAQLNYSLGKTLNFSTRNCAILWANWSWKSSLSRKIFESNNSWNMIQFIWAQRNLTFSQWSLKWEQDENLNDKSFWFNDRQNGKLWSAHLSYFTSRESYNNIIQDDFNENLEKLFREDNNSHSDASRKYVEWESFSKPKTKADVIFSIWNGIFMNKKIEINEGKIRVIFGVSSKYEIENLSDWERSALYLIIKCMYAPENWIIIVDEGETHLNSALLHDLWDRIEDERNDCGFVYISHNIEFITSRNDCTKFWIKNFNHPEHWEIEEIQNEELPEELILQIIWSKKEKILFVEWKEHKDKQLYQRIYPEFKVIAVDSCVDVINYTKSLNISPQSYHKQYFWLIDRDFRNDTEITALESKKVFSLPVAEFENLFFREEVVKFVFDLLWKQSEFQERFANLKEKVLALKSDDTFRADFYKHYITQKFNRSLANFEITTDFEFKDDLHEINALWAGIQGSSTEDFNNFLKLLNAKWIVWKTNALNLWYWWEWYRQQVLNIFNTPRCLDFRNEFLKFMPTPR